MYADLAPKYDLKEDHDFKFVVCLDNGEYWKHYCDTAYWSNDR